MEKLEPRPPMFDTSDYENILEDSKHLIKLPGMLGETADVDNVGITLNATEVGTDEFRVSEIVRKAKIPGVEES